MTTWEQAVAPDGNPVNRHLGTRYDQSGTFLPEHGNTVVCQVIPGSPTEAALIDLRAALMALPFGHHFAFTEIRSYHMTVFGGVTETRRVAGDWAEGIPTDAPVDEATAIMADRLRGFTPPPAFRMAPVAVTPFGLNLAGVTAADEGTARDWRDALSAALRLRTPDHDSYAFHTTLAYAKAWLPPEALPAYRTAMAGLTARFRARVPVMDLARPAFCRFRDMNGFPPVMTF